MKVLNFKEGEIYGIETGDYIGQMFVIIEITDEYIGCLRLPDMENTKVPKDSFEHGRNTGIITLSERSEERRVGKECRSRWSPYH